ncbi:MAG: hypothetical protein ACRCYX_04275 [Dermatophilaceae bacterium]
MVLGAVASSVLFDTSWRLEADWGLRLTSSTVTFVAPVVAAAAAFETGRRHHPVFASFAAASTRGPLVHLIPPSAIAITATLGYVVIWAGVLVTVVVSNGILPTDVWVVPETVFPVISATFLGALVGEWIRARTAAIVAAGVVVVAAVVVSPWGRGPFEVVTTYGTLTGLERPTDQAAAATLASVVTAVVCVLGARSARASVRPRLSFAMVVAVLFAVWVVPVALPWPDQVYRVSTEEVGCVGSAPALCGPRSRVPLLAMAQPTFAEAYRRLAGTEFTGPNSFRVTRLGHYSELDGAAPLDFDPAALDDGEYDPTNVVDALLRPHECRELFDAEAAVPVLLAQERTVPWLREVIDGRRAAVPTPVEVSRDFATILNCDVYTGNWS